MFHNLYVFQDDIGLSGSRRAGHRTGSAMDMDISPPPTSDLGEDAEEDAQEKDLDSSKTDNVATDATRNGRNLVQDAANNGQGDGGDGDGGDGDDGDQTGQLIDSVIERTNPKTVAAKEEIKS